jgi:hypothetical protein
MNDKWIMVWNMSFVVNSKTHVRFEVFTAASMKMAVFWVLARCSLVEGDRPDDGGSKHL